jgi:hypothetical protein
MDSRGLLKGSKTSNHPGHEKQECGTSQLLYQLSQSGMLAFAFFIEQGRWNG